MTKLTSKNWVKASINKKAKTIRFTKQFYKTQSEGLQMLSGKAVNFMILNKVRVDKMVEEGYTVVVDTPVTEAPKSNWTPQYIVGDPVIEKQIQDYYNKKKAVCFVSDVTERRQESMKTAREVLGETKFEKQQPIDMSKAYERFERSRIGQERKQQEDK